MIFYLILILLIIPITFVIAMLANAVRQEFRKDRVVALLYHRHIPSDDKADCERIGACYADRFEEQMRYLAENGYQTISLDDFVVWCRGEKRIPDKSIIITMDDGYLSNYRYAYPALRKYNLTATIFVTPDNGSGHFKRLRRIDQALTEEKMKEMSDNGVSIQSHGMTHRWLSELSPEEIEWELKESKAALERITGKPIDYLAIPGGAYNKKVERIARRVGYKAIFPNRKGTNNPKSDLYSLRRIVVERDFTLVDFQKLFNPFTALQIRIIGFFKNLPLVLLGAKRTNQLRNRLIKSPTGILFSYRILNKILMGGIGVAVILVMILTILYW